MVPPATMLIVTSYGATFFDLSSAKCREHRHRRMVESSELGMLARRTQRTIVSSVLLSSKSRISVGIDTPPFSFVITRAGTAPVPGPDWRDGRRPDFGVGGGTCTAVLFNFSVRPSSREVSVAMPRNEND